jgi:enediyne biosynthesis protein E4
MRQICPSKPSHAFVLAALALSVGACGDRTEPPSTVATAKSTEALGEVGDPTCVPGGTTYTSGRTLFADRTEQWGLEALNVTGTRLSVADVNGDNYPDLVVRSTTDEETDFSAGVRPVWVLKNTRNGKFEDITRGSGMIAGRIRGADDAVRNARASQVVAFADVDNDGDLDAFSGSLPYRPRRVTGRERSEIMLNSGYGTFTTRPVQLPELHPAGATFFDQNRDGFVDLFVPAFQRVEGATADVSGAFFRGDEDRTTSLTADVAAAVGLQRPGFYHRSSIACDLNDDGRLEIMAAAVGRRSNALFQGTATGFVERGQASGYAEDANVEWRDNLYARAYCSLVREGRGPAADLPSCAGVAEYPTELASRREADATRWDHTRGRAAENLGGNTFTTLCADFDGDGQLELYNTEERSAAEGQSADLSEVLRVTSQPEEDVTLTRPGRTATNLVLDHASDFEWTEGIQTAAVFDVDNDGRTDLYLGGSDYDYASNVGHLYQNTSTSGTIHFDEIPTADGFSQRRSQGIAVADFDRDGDLDVVVGYSRLNCPSGLLLEDVPVGNEEPGIAVACERTERVRFLENVYGSGGNWVQLKLVGAAGSNGAAIGARVTVALAGGRRLVQEVDGGHGTFGAQQDHVLHFGLGADCTAEVTVAWPDAARTTQTFPVAARHHYRLVQGVALPGELPLKGYCSTNVERLAGAVGPAQTNEYHDVYCVQDRLSALGYAGIPRPLAAGAGTPSGSRNPFYTLVPQRLSVNGALTDDTLWAIRTFQTTITNADVQAGMSGVVNPAPGNAGFQSYQWLGASNAPRWSKGGARGPGWQNIDEDRHDWGASWTFEVVGLAGAALPTGTILSNDLSVPNGGVTNDHGSHEGGLDLDVRLYAEAPPPNERRRWYEYSVVQPRLASSGGTFWSQSCAAPTTLGVSGENFIDRVVVWLWESPTEACRSAVINASRTTPKTFADGFARLVPTRAPYDRAAIQEQIQAFLSQVYPDGSHRVSRVIFMDPVLMSALRSAGFAAARLDSTRREHADHYHVDVAPPVPQPQ